MIDLTNKSQSRRQWNTALYILVGIFTIAFTLIIVFLVSNNLSQSERATSNADAQEFDGSTVIEPPLQISDFTLTDQTGEPFTLSSLRGSYVLLSFGFTHCPDVCPITLNEYKEIEKALGREASKIKFMFISVDGKRDTPTILTEYFRSKRIEDFIGLSGTETEISIAGKDFGLFYELGAPDKDGNYTVQHTAGSFLLDPNGRWVMRYAYQTDRKIIIDDLREFLGSI